MRNNNYESSHTPSLQDGYTTYNYRRREICRNFLRGTCYKTFNCIYRHVLDLELMRHVLNFCHDYQNKGYCTRQRCTYLHTSLQEENLFYATGKIPKVLAERLLSMSGSHRNFNPITRTIMNRSDNAAAFPSYSRTSLSFKASSMSVSAISFQLDSQQPRTPCFNRPNSIAPMFSVAPSPHTPSESNSAQMAFPVLEIPQLFPINFDTSRPPPTLRSIIKTDDIKHEPISSAGPSKIWKVEDQPRKADSM